MLGKWTIQKTERSDQAASILSFLLVEFSRLVGSNIMFREDCIVYNDPHVDCPILIINTLPVHIRLAQCNYSYWTQTIYQLSHEMCHYAFRQRKENKDFTLSWFEELICESVSLYALEYASIQWRNCQLSQLAPAFSQSHKEYLINELAKEYTDEFMRCNTVERLRSYEKQRISECRRESQRSERNRIYRAISNNPLELKCILSYTRYVMDNGVVIDFDRWINDDPCNLLCELNSVQPVKI